MMDKFDARYACLKLALDRASVAAGAAAATGGADKSILDSSRIVDDAQKFMDFVAGFAEQPTKEHPR